MTPNHDAEMAVPPSRRTILIVTLGAALFALIILFAGILPAEYHRDPTGLGRITGIAKLWAPEEVVLSPAATKAAGAPAQRSYGQTFRSDVIEIPLTISGDPDHGDEVEYKVHVEKGGSFVYSWEAVGAPDPEEFYTEFHGHTVDQGKAMTVAYYRKATGVSDHGVFTAPFSGVHGWYFQNQTIKPIKVRLRISGFYTLIPDGQPGNEKGFHAKPVAF